MGVPRLAPWILRFFGDAVKHFQPGEILFVVDNLFIDANPLIHEAVNLERNPINPYANLSDEERQKKMFEITWNNLVEIIERIARPTKILYIAIDGPPPIAKQAEQRKRRFVGAKGRDPRFFDRNAISPGTLFMLELTKFLHTRIRQKMTTNVVWSEIEVIFSPPTVPGEGEHKCLDYIRQMPRMKRDAERHCIVGPDGDLIMLTLAAHTPNIFLLRADQFNHGFFDMFDMGAIRERLPKTLGQVITHTRTYDDVSNDFILVGFFVGNDFLPKAQMFITLDRGLELMLGLYTSMFPPSSRDHLTKFDVSRYVIDHGAFTAFVSEVAKREKEYLLSQKNAILPTKKIFNDKMNLMTEVPDERFRDTTLLSHIKQTKFGDEIVYDFDFEGFRRDYYHKAGVNSRRQEEVKKMCLNYVRTIAWVFEYYIEGLPSWEFFYEYHYPPLMTDLSKVMKEDEGGLFSSGVAYKFTMGEPSVPFVQLLTVLPTESVMLLPRPLRSLLLDHTSPLVRAGYYPEQFKIDYAGKYKEFMGVVILPFVPIDVVREVYEKERHKLTQRYVRNTLSQPELFKYDPSYRATYESDYGNIGVMHIRKTLI
jgi:5'-3' exonuclease